MQLVKRIRHPNLVPIVAFWLKGKDGEILDDAIAGQDSLPPDGTGTQYGSRSLAPPCCAARLGPPQAVELIVAMGLGDISLFDRLQQCQSQGLDGIPPDELQGYMEDAAEAIDFLNSPVHDLGSGAAAIQHCDIKPHNLMIVGGAAQICDFGLARMLGADRATSAAATLAYACAGVLADWSAQRDDRSVLAGGELLRIPHRRAALRRRDRGGGHGRQAARTARLSRLSVPEQAVLRRATRCDPAQRFPSAVAMVKAWGEAAEGGAATPARRAAGTRRFVAAGRARPCGGRGGWRLAGLDPLE